MVWAGSFTRDIRAVGSLEACAGSDTSGVALWLEPTSFNCTQCVNLCFCHACAVHCMYLSIPEKPGSAAHPSTCTASAGLQRLLVGVRVHLVWLEPQVIVCDRRHMPTSSVHHRSIDQ